MVAIPSRRPPRGGFPVVSFAHGTTGFTDASARSRTGDTGSAYSIAELINRFLPRGWALVLPDYHGLGTAGPQAYDVGPDAAHPVLDIARAAHRLAPGRVGTKLALVGHSVGGHAVLWPGELARRYAPELRLRAVVASSPGADIAASALTPPVPRSLSLACSQIGTTTTGPRLTGSSPRPESRCSSDLR